MRVEVYWNLHKDCWSVRAMEGPDKGRVIEHTNDLAMHDCQFVVQQGGRKKVVEQGKKNVHAFVRGRLNRPGRRGYHYHGRPMAEVTYNPFRDTTFVTKNIGTPIHEARIVFMTRRQGKPSVRAVDPEYGTESREH